MAFIPLQTKPIAAIIPAVFVSGEPLVPGVEDALNWAVENPQGSMVCSFWDRRIHLTYPLDLPSR
jgi:hypothetical protein